MLEFILVSAVAPVATAVFIIYLSIAALFSIGVYLRGDVYDQGTYDHIRTRTSLFYILVTIVYGLAWPFLARSMCLQVWIARDNRVFADKCYASRSLWMTRTFEAQADLARAQHDLKQSKQLVKQLQTTMDCELRDPHGAVWDHHHNLIAEANQLLAALNTPEAKAYIEKTNPYVKAKS